MSLTIECNWQSAPQVRAPELRATWGELRIAVGDEPATLVKERESPEQVRERIDVAAYPLAEWLALNWWALDTPSHAPDYPGLNLAGAGDGFPWPAMTLRSDRQQMWIEVTPGYEPGSRVRTLSSVSAVLDADDVRRSLSRFIDTTVRRLDNAGIVGTLLQDEWTAIQEADEDERQFASVAAAWGFDPYNMDDEEAKLLLSVGEVLRDDALLADLARAIPFSELESAERWMHSALQHGAQSFSRVHQPLPVADPLLNVSGVAPWREGYRRARSLREQLGLSLTRRVPVEEFVALTNVSTPPPGNIDALAEIGEKTATAIVGPDIDPRSPRARFKT